MCLYMYSFMFTFTWGAEVKALYCQNGWRIELLAKILEENKSLFFSATFYYASLLWHLKVQTARRLTPHANRPLERKLYGKILRYIFFCNFNCVWRIFGHDLPRIRWDGKQFNGSLLTVVLEKFFIPLVLSLASTEVFDSPHLKNHRCIEQVPTQLCQLLMSQQKVESNQFWQNLAIKYFLAAFLSETT